MLISNESTVDDNVGVDTSGDLVKMFESQPVNYSPHFITNEEIQILLPKQFSRDPHVCEDQILRLLDSIRSLRPLSRREEIMPGLKNVIGNQRNLTLNTVRNMCYFNAATFMLSSIDEIVHQALVFVKNENSSFKIEDALDDNRKKTKTPSARDVVIGKKEWTFKYNMCVLLISMRYKTLKDMVFQKYNYQADSVVIDSTLVAGALFTELNIGAKDQGMRIDDVCSSTFT
jgi:hypothetical protein